MSEAASRPLPERVSPETIRAARLFHGLEREELAAMFRVSVRTIFRWEARGVDPAALPLDPGAKDGPAWRRKLLSWLVDRYRGAAVTDNRKGGEGA